MRWLHKLFGIEQAIYLAEDRVGYQVDQMQERLDRLAGDVQRLSESHQRIAREANYQGQIDLLTKQVDEVRRRADRSTQTLNALCEVLSDPDE